MSALIQNDFAISSPSSFFTYERHVLRICILTGTASVINCDKSGLLNALKGKLSRIIASAHNL